MAMQITLVKNENLILKKKKATYSPFLSPKSGIFKKCVCKYVREREPRLARVCVCAHIFACLCACLCV